MVLRQLYIVFFQSEFSRRLRSGVASCKFRYCFASLRPSCSCLILSPILVRPVFPSIMCFRKEFLHKVCPIQLTFLHFVARSMYLPPFCCTRYVPSSILLHAVCTFLHFVARSMYLPPFCCTQYVPSSSTQ